MLVLASRSPRRAELLRAAGIRFRIAAPEEADVPPVAATKGYARLVVRAALEKARSVAAHTEGVVLGADTVVVCDKIVLGKPSSRAEASRMLGLLSGRWHTVHTGVALVCGKRHETGHECTGVAFRELSKSEISRYLASGEPMDKAGAYAIQGAGAAFVRAIRGCYTNVVGLPVPLVLRMLEEFGEAGVARGGSAGRRLGRRSRNKRGS